VSCKALSDRNQSVREPDSSISPIQKRDGHAGAEALMFPSLVLFETLSAPFKRSQLGLFHGKMKQYGNNVPFSKKKTRRNWLPNVQKKRLLSETLGEKVTVKVTTRALRTIKKVCAVFIIFVHAVLILGILQYGGLDQYVFKTKPELLGWEGMRLRVAIREQKEQKERLTTAQEGQNVDAGDAQHQ
jgi:large subunit ribosomal protein L28